MLGLPAILEVQPPESLTCCIPELEVPFQFLSQPLLNGASDHLQHHTDLIHIDKIIHRFCELSQFHISYPSGIGPCLYVEFGQRNQDRVLRSLMFLGFQRGLRFDFLHLQGQWLFWGQN